MISRLKNAEKSRCAKKIAVFVKKTAENFAESENSSTFAAVLRMSCGVMVARRILVPPVRVRILPRQQETLTIFSQASLFCAYDRRYAAECILVDK